jgi:PAS domain S-box-containing protein
MEKFPFSQLSQEEQNLQAVNEAHSLHHAIIHATEFAILSTNPEGIITIFNKAAEKLTGYNGSEVIGIQTLVIFHLEEEILKRSQELSEELGVPVASGIETFTVKVREKNKADRNKWTFVKKDGTRFPVVLSVTSIWNGDHHLGYCATAIEISEQKQIQPRIEESEALESEVEMRRMADENSRIFNNSLTLGALATFDGYFKKLNPIWEKTLGWTRDELLSNPFLSFVHPDDLAKTEEILKLIGSGHTMPTFENRYRCKDGSYRWLLWSSSPDIERKIIYASAIDITSRKKSEEELLMSKRNLEVAAFELEEQNRQLDEFAHIISHNLRAPVNNIKALLNFINDTSRVSDYQLIFEKIRNVTFNISETMNELLETIRIKKNHEIERVEIRFKDVLDKVIQSLEGELIESGATVTYNFNNAPKIYYSKTYLESILQNLISNSIKYRSTERIPEIFVSTDLVKNGIELRVQDNGLGIDLKQFGHKLFGLHKTFHENKEARGVGLFLTKTQIETLGGNITAESIVDGGTTFIIQF